MSPRRIWPLSGTLNPASRFMMVDFPLPDRPKIPVLGADSSNATSRVKFPKDFFKLTSSSTLFPPESAVNAFADQKDGKRKTNGHQAQGQGHLVPPWNGRILVDGKRNGLGHYHPGLPVR